MKRGIETWTSYDRAGFFRLHIKKARGKLSLEEIREACREYDEGFYMLFVDALRDEAADYYDLGDIEGDSVVVYTADDFFSWREKEERQ